MKTAKEWFIEQPSDWRGAKPKDFTEWLKAVQLDAFKEGMTHAAMHISEYVALSKLLLQERDRIEHLE